MGKNVADIFKCLPDLGEVLSGIYEFIIDLFKALSNALLTGFIEFSLTNNKGF